jgi:hypothetical protein
VKKPGDYAYQIAKWMENRIAILKHSDNINQNQSNVITFENA